MKREFAICIGQGGNMLCSLFVSEQLTKEFPGRITATVGLESSVQRRETHFVLFQKRFGIFLDENIDEVDCAVGHRMVEGQATTPVPDLDRRRGRMKQSLKSGDRCTRCHGKMKGNHTLSILDKESPALTVDKPSELMNTKGLPFNGKLTNLGVEWCLTVLVQRQATFRRGLHKGFQDVCGGIHLDSEVQSIATLGIGSTCDDAVGIKEHFYFIS